MNDWRQRSSPRLYRRHMIWNALVSLPESCPSYVHTTNPPKTQNYVTFVQCRDVKNQSKSQIIKNEQCSTNISRGHFPKLGTSKYSLN